MRGPAGQFDAGMVDLPDASLGLVFGQAAPGGSEGVGQEDVGSRGPVFGMDGLDVLRPFEVPEIGGVAGGKPSALEQGSHGAVEDEDVLFEPFEKRNHASFSESGGGRGPVPGFCHPMTAETDSRGIMI